MIQKIPGTAFANLLRNIGSALLSLFDLRLLIRAIAAHKVIPGTITMRLYQGVIEDLRKLTLSGVVGYSSVNSD